MSLSLEETARLHGHKGPFLVLGYRAGRKAVEILKPETEFDLVAILYIPSITPYTCIADGVQGATRCTLGKGNIAIINSDEFKIVFEKKSGEKLIIWLDRDFIEKIKSMNMDEAADMVEKAGEGEIFCKIETML